MPEEERCVLIVGEDTFGGRNILNAARALALEGWTVGLGSPVARLAASSRYISKKHIVPSPGADLDGFLDAIRRLVANHGYEAVFAGGDAEVLALASAGDSLGVRSAYPPLPVAIQSLDKLDLEYAAIEAGFAPLGTRLATDEALAEVNGTVVVKPRLHWNPARPLGPTRLDARIVPGRTAARARVAEIKAAGGEPVLQSYVEGTAMAYNVVLARDGSVLAEYQQHTEREWGGTASQIRLIPTDRDLADRAQALLRHIGWFGLAQLQFIVGSDGAARITDLNGRYYASIGFSAAIGLNLPAIWAAAATGRAIASQKVPCGEARYLWLQGELLRALSSPKRRMHEVIDVLRYRRHAVHSLWRDDDPWPTFWFVVYATPRVLRLAAHFLRTMLAQRQLGTGQTRSSALPR